MLNDNEQNLPAKVASSRPAMVSSPACFVAADAASVYLAKVPSLGQFCLNSDPLSPICSCNYNRYPLYAEGGCIELGGGLGYHVNAVSIGLYPHP